MKAQPIFMESNPEQASPKSMSKRSNMPPTGGLANLYARLRRLEQRIERIEATISTTRRDVYRIEKKQQREAVAPSIPPSNQEIKIPVELFG